MSKLPPLIILLLICLAGCKKNGDKPVVSDELSLKIENDPLFIDWATARNGRWVFYALEKIDKSSISKDNLFQLMHRAVRPVNIARNSLREALHDKYNASHYHDFDGKLEALYLNHYERINSSLRRRQVMNDKYDSYKNLIPERSAIAVNSDLPEYIITACGLPQDLLQFFNTYVGFGQPPSGAGENIILCKLTYIAQLDNIINSMRNLHNPDPGSCGPYVSAAYDAMMGFYECDFLDPDPDDSPEDPYPPGGGGGGSGSTAGEPGDYSDFSWWNDNTTSFDPQELPDYTDMMDNYPTKPDGTELCAADVFSLVGGQVLANMPPHPNACALRVSRALNYSGVTIPVIAGHTFQGSDGKNYFLSAARLYNFMKKTFTVPPNPSGSVIEFTGAQGGANGANFPSLLSPFQGIYMMQPNYPARFGATGHASVFDGSSCVVNTCEGGANPGTYFDADGGVHKITIFKLN